MELLFAAVDPDVFGIFRLYPSCFGVLHGFVQLVGDLTNLCTLVQVDVSFIVAEYSDDLSMLLEEASADADSAVSSNSWPVALLFTVAFCGGFEASFRNMIDDDAEVVLSISTA